MNCLVCRGACCESIELDLGFHPPNPDSERWIKLHGVEKNGKISFEAKCLKLTSNGTCEIWEDRPLVCELYIAGSHQCLETVRERRTPEQYLLIREEEDPSEIHV